jgi:hypothetical protein
VTAKRRKLILFLGLIVILAGACWAFANFVFNPLTGVNPVQHRQYESIETGMTREEVVRRMGRPADEGVGFHLGQYEGHENQYEAAKQSNSRYYLFWYSAIDMTYAVGFDDRDTVAVKACGST